MSSHAKRISVRVSTCDLREIRGAIRSEMMLLDALRAAGIPAVGILCYCGVESGELVRTDDEAGALFEWIPPQGEAP